MFFLFYVPSESEPLSSQAINELAGQIAHQMVEQMVNEPAEPGSDSVTPKATPDVEPFIRAQLAAMMLSMQNKALKQREQSSAVGPNNDLGEEEPAELTETRDFLERCFLRSA